MEPLYVTVMDETGDQETLLESRQYQAEVQGYAHALEADKLQCRHQKLGVPSVILSTIVGTTAFASLERSGDTQFWIAVSTGVLSVIAAVLTGLQTFFGYAVTAKKHADAATKLFSLARKWQLLLPVGPSEKRDAEIKELDAELTKIVSDAPRVTLAAQEAADRKIRADRKKYRPGQKTPPPDFYAKGDLDRIG